jgi:hypothetical protein
MKLNKIGVISRDSEANLRDLADAFQSGASGKLPTQRFFFNLTDGDEVILDDAGLEVPNITAAHLHAHEIIADLRREDPSLSGEWAGWRIEIVNTAGWTVEVLSLDLFAQGSPFRH